MSISPLASSPTIAAPVALPQENERAEKRPDNEALEATQRSPLKEGLGTKIDVSV